MIDPFEHNLHQPPSRLRFQRQAAWWALTAERLTASFWAAVLWILLFAALWMLNVPTLFGAYGGHGALFIYAAGLFVFIRKGLKNFRSPTAHDIDRRLESDSGLKHRPLSGLGDTLANPQTAPTRNLWKAGKEFALRQTEKLKLKAPRPFLAQADKKGTRFAVALLLLLGFAVAGKNWSDKIVAGLSPFQYAADQNAARDKIVLWITPPDYTAQPRITLQGGGKLDKTLDIPDGSIVKARVSNGVGTPVLVMGETKLPFKKLDNGAYALETMIAKGESLKIRQFLLTRTTIPYRFIADAPPSVAMDGKPTILQKGQFDAPLKVKDDYGVRDVTLTIKLDPMIEDAPMADTISQTRTVMSAPNEESAIKPIYDLSGHPWAGLPVIAEFIATDAKGQTGSSGFIKMTLPERTFQNPVAAHIAALRKELLWTPLAAAAKVAFDLETLLSAPDTFNNDPVVFLSIRAAASRLIYAPDDVEGIQKVAALLWDTALKIEDGNLGLATRKLREAQQALQKTLNDPNASPQEIAQKMSELQEAMAGYFQELYQDMQKKLAEGKMPQLPPDAFANAMNLDDLSAFMDQMMAKAQSGDRQTAQEMLSQLEKMMNSLDAGADQPMPEDMQQMMKGMSEIQKLVERQKDLLDQTQRQADAIKAPATEQTYPEFVPLDDEAAKNFDGDIPPPPMPRGAQKKAEKPKIDTHGGQATQESIRLKLGDLMVEADNQLGEIPMGLQKAEPEMRGSSDSLGKNAPSASIPHQEKALEYLQEALNDLNKQFSARMQQMMALSLGGGQTDPLGRPIPNSDKEGGNQWGMGSRVKIPDEAQRKKAQEILRTIRRRAGDFNRPEDERQYFNRLLRQF